MRLLLLAPILLLVTGPEAMTEGAPPSEASSSSFSLESSSSQILAPVWFLFIDPPHAHSLDEAVRWSMETVAGMKGVPVSIYRLPSRSDNLFFADSTWDGYSPAPTGSADATVLLQWMAQGEWQPCGDCDGCMIRRAVGLDLPGDSLRKMTLIYAGAGGDRSAYALDHVPFNLCLDDASRVAGSDVRIIVEARRYGSNDWSPTGLSVWGSVLETGPVSEGPTGRGPSDSTVALSPRRLAITRIPNTGSTALAFDIMLGHNGGARLELFDLQGRRVTTRDLDGSAESPQRVSLDGRRIPSGVYWARVVQGRAQITTKTTWLK